MRILVTAGPTREFLDDVRFVSNPSSGRMGFALAAAAARAGHQVRLVAGPVALRTPRGVERADVVSARDMRREVLRAYGASDAVVMTAAVCDYRPARRQRGKVKKGARRMLVEMVRNPDILAQLGRRKGGRVLVGFALESPLDREEARRKLRAKNLDAIVLNSPEAFSSRRSTVEIFTAAGQPLRLEQADKRTTARRLMRLIEQIAARRAGRGEA